MTFKRKIIIEKQTKNIRKKVLSTFVYTLLILGTVLTY
jgi:hypothetical protein